MQLEDLEEKCDKKSVNLRLSRMERYLHGPTPMTSSRYTSSQDLIAATNNVAVEIDSWNPNLTHVCCAKYSQRTLFCYFVCVVVLLLLLLFLCVAGGGLKGGGGLKESACPL